MTSKLARVPVSLGNASAAATRLRLLQWNLLADGLAQGGDFCRVKPEVLEWPYRKPLIMAEVLEACADVLCFQELNYFDELQADLAAHGFQGVFLPKRHSPATKYNSPADGVAIFWRTDRLELVGKPERLHFIDRHGAPCAQCCLHVILREVLPPSNQPQQACSQAGDPAGSSPAPRQVLIATTHLKAKEGADLDEVRFMQMQQLLYSLQATLIQAGSNAPGEVCIPPSDTDTPSIPTNNNGSNGSSTAHLNGSGPYQSPVPGLPSAAGTAAAGGGGGSGLNDSCSQQGPGTPAAGLMAGAGGGPGPVQHCTPVIIAGDFNATPGSAPCKLLASHPWNFQSMWDVPVLSGAVGVGGAGAAGGGVGAGGAGVGPSSPSLNGSHPSNNGTVSTGAGAAVQGLQEGNGGSGSDDGGLQGQGQAQVPGQVQGQVPGNEFSTWKFRSGGESKRIIDHIWFTQEAGLMPVSRWRMLSEEEIGRDGLPCPAYPSDHVALCCEFNWL